MNLHVIASGSKGNAAIVYDEKTHILIDIGISKQELINGLKEIKLSLKDIDFVLITHDHSDHIKNVHIFIAHWIIVSGRIKHFSSANNISTNSKTDKRTKENKRIFKRNNNRSIKNNGNYCFCFSNMFLNCLHLWRCFWLRQRKCNDNKK